jgi:hypothetical protein
MMLLWEITAWVIFVGIMGILAYGIFRISTMTW